MNSAGDRISISRPAGKSLRFPVTKGQIFGGGEKRRVVRIGQDYVGGRSGVEEHAEVFHVREQAGREYGVDAQALAVQDRFILGEDRAGQYGNESPCGDAFENRARLAPGIQQSGDDDIGVNDAQHACPGVRGGPRRFRR